MDTAFIHSAGLVLAMALVLATAAHGQPTEEDARRLFEMVDHIAETDRGELWGRALAGPVLLVDPESRLSFSNVSVAGFEANDGLWAGKLPDSIAVANTAFDWRDGRFTMLRHPIPDDADALRRLAAHELWHRIQSDLGFPSASPGNEHLGARDGRYWLILEMRALAAALRQPGDYGAVRHALGFRQRRYEAFPQAREQETALILHEGLAQYTGWALSALPRYQRRALVADDLAALETEETFVRSFAYAVGPAYGLLLDDQRPSWRAEAPGHHPADLLRHTPSEPTDPERYGASDVAASEDRREARRLAALERAMIRYVTGPRLRLDFHRMNVSFDPGRVDVLPGHGTVYGTMTLRDEWGVLEVNGGALMASDWSHVTVPAPAPAGDGPIQGEGYTLQLNPSWHLREESPGVFVALPR